MKNQIKYSYFQRKITFLIVTLAGLLVNPSLSSSQEVSTCFLIDRSGRTIDFNGTSVCPLRKESDRLSSIGSDSDICHKIKQDLGKQYCNIALNLVTAEELSRAVKVSVSTDKISYGNVCKEKVLLKIKEPVNFQFLGKVKPYEIFSGVYVINGKVYSQTSDGTLNRHSYTCVFSNSPEPEKLGKISVTSL